MFGKGDDRFDILEQFHAICPKCGAQMQRVDCGYMDDDYRCPYASYDCMEEDCCVDIHVEF